jgi:hypothetical protein
MRWRSELIENLGKHGERFVIMLDIDKVFTLDELGASAALGARDPSDHAA